MIPARTGILLILIALVLAAGCTQSSPTPASPVTAAVTTPAPTLQAPLQTPDTYGVPMVTVTLIHYIVPAKSWKDSELHIAFQAPQDWNVTTRQVSLPEGSQGLVFKTDLVSNDVFFIRTFPISLNDDQAFRDTFRAWPGSIQTTVTLNGIIFDRFESANNGITQVGYVAQKGSANDLGFSSVLKYTTDGSQPFEKEDFEKVIASFTYLTGSNAATAPGAEIPRLR